MSDKLVSVNDNYDFPAPVAARQAKRLGDTTTAEGKAVEARSRAASAARRGARYAILGDSLASFGFGYPTGENAGASGAFTANWPQLTALMTKGEIVFTERYGVPGSTTAQILARVPSVVASGVRGAVVLGGANDHNPATTIANLKLIYAQLNDAGLEAIACLVPPQNDAVEVGYRARINSWIQAYAERHNMTVLDLHTPLVDPLTGQYKAGLFYDSVHMNQKGHLAIARYIVPRLQGRIGGGGWRPRLATYAGDSSNLFGDGLFTGSDGAAGLANTLTSVPAGGATGYVYSRVPVSPGEDAPGGNWQRIARTAGAVGNVQVRRTLPVTTSGGPINVGDRLSFAGAIRATGREATSTGAWGIQVVFVGTTAAAPQSFSIQWQIANMWAADVSGTFYEEHEVPAGTTSLQINFVSTPGEDATNFDFGGIRLENLTAMGALTN